MGVINSDGGTVLTSNEKVEETVITTGSYSSGAKKPPGTSDASKKHRSSKVGFYFILENDVNGQTL